MDTMFVLFLVVAVVGVLLPLALVTWVWSIDAIRDTLREWRE